MANRKPADREKERERNRESKRAGVGGGEDGTAEKERHKINLRKGTVEETLVE